MQNFSNFFLSYLKKSLLITFAPKQLEKGEILKQQMIIFEINAVGFVKGAVKNKSFSVELSSP